MTIYNPGDLVELTFRLKNLDYGYGVILERKSHTPTVNAYRIHWSNYHPTWEAGRALQLKASIKKK